MTSTRIDKTKYASGDTVFIIKGPKKGRNWFTLTTNPEYKISQDGTANVKLQGTNEIQQGSNDPNPFSPDLEPPPGATWTDIVSSATNATGTFSTEYEFLRVIVSAAGTGHLYEAWARWN